MNLEKTKVQGMKVIPTGERKCIWMDAGVVSYKLCTNQFQCNLCEFDRAMSSRAQQAKAEVQEYKPTPTHKKEIVAWMEEFRQFPADQRKCRYMLSGEVSYKICPNSFRCGECTFDQMMQDRIQPAFEGDSKSLPQVAGFYLSEKLYYFRNHTWLRLERNGQYRLGIDDFASRLIGKPQGIVLPPIGKNLDLEEYAWTVNHIHSDLEFVSPVKGVVTSTNEALLDDAALINQQPYSEGWLMTIEPESITKSNRNFLTGEEANAWMVEEANLLSKHLQAEAGVTMHDGASINHDISSHLSKEKWNEIVKKHFYVR
ncbi:MAG: glycine cleavage system protein H [Candidatus Aminicenantes bacterium]|nr:MAG: glycine cleavage system protein H [Candidatus Aminicenantes bacterium]